MSRLALATAFLLAGSLAALADPGPDDLQLACAGPFAKDADLKAVIAVFGKANVKQDKIDGAEGESITATVVYGDDPAKRLEIIWWDEEGHRRPSTIRVTNEQSAWTLGALKVGSPVAEVNKANGKPFKISGFDWDYGGQVQDWNGGKVPGLGGKGCSVQVTFTHEGNLPQRLVGDGATVTSTDKGLAAGKTTVQTLGIGWPAE